MTHIEQILKALDDNNLNPKWVETKEEALELVKSMLPEGAKVGVGGSVTLDQIGVIDELKGGKYNYIDTRTTEISDDEKMPRYREALTADFFLTSSNAVIEDGRLYNVDARSNRVAAMLFGPEKVIVIAGVNKIVSTLDEAIKRNHEIAAPLNAKRLDRKTPCAKTMKCCDCKSPGRICSNYVVMGPQSRFPNRVSVILVNENLGY